MTLLRTGDRVEYVAAHSRLGGKRGVFTAGTMGENARHPQVQLDDGMALSLSDVAVDRDLRWVCPTCDRTHPKDTSCLEGFAASSTTQAYSAYVTNTFSSTSSFTTTWPSTPKKDNDMRITTVRTKAGYVGQVINSITEQIVHETKPYKHQDKAIRAAQKASDAALERAFK